MVTAMRTFTIVGLIIVVLLALGNLLDKEHPRAKTKDQVRSGIVWLFSALDRAPAELGEDFRILSRQLARTVLWICAAFVLTISGTYIGLRIGHLSEEHFGISMIGQVMIAIVIVGYAAAGLAAVVNVWLSLFYMCSVSASIILSFLLSMLSRVGAALSDEDTSPMN